MSDFTVMDNGQPVKITDFERRILQAADNDPGVKDQPEIKTELVETPFPLFVKQAANSFYSSILLSITPGESSRQERPPCIFSIRKSGRTMRSEFSPTRCSRVSPSMST